MIEWVALGVTAATVAVQEFRLRRAGKKNEQNQERVEALETGKLDLSVAELGHDILMDLLNELRAEVAACHEDREAQARQIQDLLARRQEQ